MEAKSGRGWCRWSRWCRHRIWITHLLEDARLSDHVPGLEDALGTEIVPLAASAYCRAGAGGRGRPSSLGVWRRQPRMPQCQAPSADGMGIRAVGRSNKLRALGDQREDQSPQKRESLPRSEGRRPWRRWTAFCWCCEKKWGLLLGGDAEAASTAGTGFPPLGGQS